MHFEIQKDDPQFEISKPQSRDSKFEITNQISDEPFAPIGKIEIPLKDHGIDFISQTHFHRGPRNNGKGFKLIAWSLVAAVIDALLICAITIFFTLSAHLLTYMSLRDMKDLVQEMPQLPMLAIAGMIFFYMSVQRVFMGHTIGEWACGLRLGQAKQRLAKYYGLRVCLRVFLILASGLIVFPLLSMFTGRDVLGRWLRLPLIQLDPNLR